MTVRVRVLKKFHLSGTIDRHDPIGVTLLVTGGERPFRVTFVTVNWGRGYDPGEFKRNVLRVLNRVGELEYVILLVQELDEDDKAPEHRVFKSVMEPGTTLVGWATREPIAVSPGVRVTRKNTTLLMKQGTDIGAPEGTGPDRQLVSCVVHIHGVRIGAANQHPHRNLPHPAVQKARINGERITRMKINELNRHSDFVVYGGDMNDHNYPKINPNERELITRGPDTLRLVS